MCVLRISFFLFLFYGPIAHAKVWNFSSGAAFGIGLKGIVSQVPVTDVVDKATAGRTYSRGFSLEPFFDFRNFGIRLIAQGILPPIYNNSGAFSGFSDTADFYLAQYGLHLQLNPFVSNDNRRRVFLKAGYSLGTLNGENKRTYTNGLTFEEKYSGSTTEILAALGFEFFFVQNYSLSWELGYTQSEVTELSYKGGTNLTGVEKEKGLPLLTDGGLNRKINLNSGYLGIGLNLNF